MVLHYPANEKVTLCACSQTAYDFRYTALYFLGYRLKGCTPLVAKRASQYARSLDLSISNKTAIYRGILESVSRHPESVGPVLRSEPPLTVRSALYLRQAQPEEKPREMTTAPGSTVTELCLCGYRLSSYEEMISLIHSFPLFNFPSTRDCINGEQASGGNTLTGLPDHKLSTFSNDSLINVSNLIEDAALEVGSLTPLQCATWGLPRKPNGSQRPSLQYQENNFKWHTPTMNPRLVTRAPLSPENRHGPSSTDTVGSWFIFSRCSNLSR